MNLGNRDVRKMASAHQFTNSHRSMSNGHVSDDNMMSIQEIEERILQLLTENADLRSKCRTKWRREMRYTFTDNNCSSLWRYFAAEQYIHETALGDTAPLARRGPTRSIRLPAEVCQSQRASTTGMRARKQVVWKECKTVHVKVFNKNSKKELDVAIGQQQRRCASKKTR